MAIAKEIQIMVQCSSSLVGEYNVSIAGGNIPDYITPLETQEKKRVSRYVYQNNTEIESLRSINTTPTFMYDSYIDSITLSTEASYKIVYFIDDGSHDVAAFPSVNFVNNHIFFYSILNITGTINDNYNTTAFSPFAFINFGSNPGKNTLSISAQSFKSINLLDDSLSGNASFSSSSNEKSIVFPVGVPSDFIRLGIKISFTKEKEGKRYDNELTVPLKRLNVTNVFDVENAPLKRYIDLKTLPKWKELTYGNHTLQIVARAPEHSDSDKSEGVTFVLKEYDYKFENGILQIYKAPYTFTDGTVRIGG